RPSQAIRRRGRLQPLPSSLQRDSQRTRQSLYHPPMSKQQKSQPTGGTIALNTRANHEYFIEQRFEAGIALAGWEVKSLRAGSSQIVDSYILLKDGEAYLFGAHITPLQT